MKKRILLSITVLAAFWNLTGVHAESVHFFSYEEWKELSQRPEEKYHQMVLKDGSKLYGTVEKLPPLHYSFITMNFKVTDVIAVAVVKNDSNLKLQYITRNGQNYVTSCSQESFVCTVSEKKLDGTVYEKTKELHPQWVDYIILDAPPVPFAGYNARLASLEFKNGDKLPVAILTNPIHVTNGWKDGDVQIKDIAELSFDGGLHGKIYKKGHLTDLDFSYIKDTYLFVEVPKTRSHIKFPWSQIAHVQMNNGGFARENEIQNPLNSSLVPLPSSLSLKSSQIGVEWHQTNNESYKCGPCGNELSGSLAAVSLSQNSVAAAENIGLDYMFAADKIFSESDRLCHLTDCEIEEFVSEKELLPLFDDGFKEEQPIVFIDDLLSDEEIDFISSLLEPINFNEEVAINEYLDHHDEELIAEDFDYQEEDIEVSSEKREEIEAYLETIAEEIDSTEYEIESKTESIRHVSLIDYLWNEPKNEEGDQESLLINELWD